MGKLEEILLEYDDKLIIEEGDLEYGLNGVYQDGLIIINRNISIPKKLETFAEELAHHKITYGDITDQEILMNKKYEIKARRYGYEIIISLDGIISAYQHGVHNLYEMAKFFEVTEEYIEMTLKHYKAKYGISTYHKGYVIKFDPLQVFKHIEFN